MPIKRPTRAALLALLLLALSPPAWAQRGAAPAPAAPEPERSMAVFGDWAVRCEGTGGARNCEVTQTVQNSRSEPVGVFAIGRLARGDPMKLVAQVPVNVLLTAPPRLVLEGGTTTGTPLALNWRQCIPTGCYAEIDLRDTALLTRLAARTAEQAGRLAFKQASGADAALPMSFRGLAQALEALARE